jgi:hypothetical protein
VPMLKAAPSSSTRRSEASGSRLGCLGRVRE